MTKSKTSILILTVLVLLFAAVSFSGCLGGDQNNNNTTNVTPPEAAFVLTISAEETSLPQGEDFRVNVELRNDSGEDVEIVYSILFWPRIPGWEPFGGIAIDPPEPQTRLFEAGSVIRNVDVWGNEGEGWLLGSDLEQGTHELTFRASFSLISVGDNGEFIEQQISIVSPAILLTVQ